MSKKFIITILALFAIVGGGFFFVLRWGSEPTPAAPAAPTPPPPQAPPPPAPSVSVTEENAKTGNMIYVEWANLPGGATELEIFRSLKGKDQWSLWKTIPLTGDDISSGNVSFNIGKSDYSNYDFYSEAVGTGGNGGTVDTTSTLWTSNPTEPVVTTPSSTTSGAGNDNEPPPSNPTSTPSSTGNQPPPAPPSNPTSTPTSTPPAPSGTPYYNPQVQVSSYQQNPTANFWVQHVDQTIQIGWQNLPVITTSIVISRSASSTGPWSPLLTQTNPGQNGSYSIQVVDETVDQPYYYLMDANAGTTTVATYGPFYLAPVGS